MDKRGPGQRRNTPLPDSARKLEHRRLAVKVAFIGTHGVGKTTLAYGLAMRLKELGANVGFLEEVQRAAAPCR